VDEKQFRVADIFETLIPPLKNAVHPSRFKF